MSDLSTLGSVLVGAFVYHVARNGLPSIPWPRRAPASIPQPQAFHLPAPPGPPPGSNGEPPADATMDFDRDWQKAQAFDTLVNRFQQNGTLIDEEAWPR